MPRGVHRCHTAFRVDQSMLPEELAGVLMRVRACSPAPTVPHG
jgi:hypothetical protein